jgi:hypothetical protein
MKTFSVLGIALQYTLEVLPILRRTNNLQGVLKSNATWELFIFPMLCINEEIRA